MKISNISATIAHILLVLVTLVWATLPQLTQAEAPLKAWGLNDYAQATVPSVPSGVNYTFAIGSRYSSAAIRSDGQLAAFGYNGWGNLNVPALPAGLTYVKVATPGHGYNSIALRSNGTAVAWGYNGYGECNVPALPAGMVYTDVAGSHHTSILLRSDGNIIGFGWNGWGNGTAPALPAGVTYTAVAGQYHHCLAIRSDGQVVGFGYNGWGNTVTPALPAGLTYTKVAAGYYHSLGLLSNGTVVGWGYNGYGECNVPALPAGMVYTQIAAGQHYSYALRSDGNIIVWGYNGWGNLNVPTIPSSSIFTGVASGWHHGLALVKDLVTVTLNGAASMEILLGGSFSDLGATATDDLGNSLAVTTTGAVNTNALGSYVLTYTATDSAGRVGSAKRTVDVIKKLSSDLWVAAMPSYARSLTYANAALGEPLMVWGRAWNGTPPYSYDLDYGDGSAHLTGSGVSAAAATFIGAEHTYSSSGTKTMRLTVTDSASRTYTREATIRVLSTPTHDERVNMAIEKGLIYLYKNQTTLDSSRIYWNVAGWNHIDAAAYTGAPVLAFEENGHESGHDYEDDIYAETVAKGLNHVLDNSQGVVTTLTPHSDGIAVRDSDSNGNGKGAYTTSHSYASAFGALALALARNSPTAAQNAIVKSGPFAGMNYYDLITDILDQYAFSQGDGGTRGGFEYNVNSSSQPRYDGSAQQWPALLAMVAKERWGINTPQWYKDNTVYGYKVLQNANGGSGYSHSGEENRPRTGGMLVGYAVGNKLPGDADVNKGIKYIADRWHLQSGTGTGPNPGDPSFPGEFYTLYGVKKGLSLQGVTTLNTPAAGIRDWYQDASAWLLGPKTSPSLIPPAVIWPNYRSTSYAYGQNADGSWNNNAWVIANGSFSTAHAILILTRSVTVAVPVAVAGPIPLNLSARNPASFRLDGRASYHQDNSIPIVEYLWILDAPANPNWAAATITGDNPLVTNPGWNTVSTHTATLRVKDNQNPPQVSIATININVTLADVPPVAVPIPPTRVPALYTGNLGETIVLDGSSSYDVDGDPIVQWAWNLDGNSTYGDAADIALDTSGNGAVGATASMVFTSNYNGQVGLKVWSQPRDVNGNPVGARVSAVSTAPVDVFGTPTDLYVSSLIATNLNPTVSADISATLTSAAGSNAASNVVVRFYKGNPFAGGVQLGGNYTVNIPAGGSSVLNVPNLQLLGATALWAFVDASSLSGGQVPEYNEANNTASVNVSNQPPIAKAKDVIVFADAHCEAAVAAAQVNNGSSDPDGDQLTLTLSPAGPFAVGDTQVTLTVSDGKVSSTATATITVVDNTAPEIVCPANIAVNNDAGVCGAVVTYEAPIGTDNCADAMTVRTAGLASGSVFPIGTTVNTFEVTDAAGLKSSCSFSVTVTDAENPVIVCPANIAVNNDAGVCEATVAYATPVGTDNCPGAMTVQTAGLASGSVFPIGTTVNTFEVTDAAGLKSQCSFSVTVTDAENPVIVCPADIAVNNDAGVCGATVTYTAPVGTDNCPGAMTVQTAGLASGSVFPIGTTVNTFEVTDAAGLKSSCSFSVTVTDAENPVIVCPASIAVNNDAGVCGATVTYTAPVGTDNCPDAMTVQTAGLASGSVFPIGTTVNTFEVTDAAGLKSSCSFSVTVTDAENPVITCPANKILVSDSGSCNATGVNLGTPVISDNCPGASVANNHPSTTYPVGVTTVTWTVTDASGNTATCNQTVTVVSSINPSLSGFRPPLAGQPVGNKIRRGQVVPHKLLLKNCSGQTITSGVTVYLKVQGISQLTGLVVEEVAEDAQGVGTDGSLQSDGLMRLTDSQYHFNLDTGNFGDANTIAGDKYYRSTATVVDNATLMVLGTITINLETSSR